MYSSLVILSGSVTNTATPTFDLLVGFSTASRLETVNICAPILPSRLRPDIFISLNFFERSVASASISLSVSSARAYASTKPAIIPPCIWLVATLPLPTTGWSLEPCSITSIGIVEGLWFVPDETADSGSTITGPEPVFPNLTWAAPLLM